MEFKLAKSIKEAEKLYKSDDCIGERVILIGKPLKDIEDLKKFQKKLAKLIVLSTKVGVTIKGSPIFEKWKKKK